MILVINQLPPTPFPHCRSRPHFIHWQSKCRAQGQGGGGRARLALEILLHRCPVSFLFHKWKKNPNLKFGMWQRTKYSVTPSPKWKWSVPVSRKHLNTCQKSESGDQQSRFPLWWLRHQTAPFDLKEPWCLLPSLGTPLKRGGLDFPHWLHTILCQRTSRLTTGNKSFLGHRNLMRERKAGTNTSGDWTGPSKDGDMVGTN